MTTIAEQIAQARLENDRRILRTNVPEVFLAASDRQAYKDIRLCVLTRPEAKKATLMPLYKKVGQLYRQNPSLDLTTRAKFDGEKLNVDIPNALIEIGVESDLLKTAELYASRSGEKRFDLKPSTVVDADLHPHATTVLSISWNGAGLVTEDEHGRETFQLQQADLGLLKPGMMHRSPYRSELGRFVMFTAPPKDFS